MQHFGKSVSFTTTTEVPISEFFNPERLTPGVRAEIGRRIFDFKRGAGDRAEMQRGFVAQLHRESAQVGDIQAFAKPYLPEISRSNTLEALVEVLVDTQLRRLEHWRTVKAADGQPVIDASPYNEYTWWDALPGAGYSAEVIITNQLIASAENGDNSVHSAIRGGVTNGNTSANPKSTLGTTALVSIYPMMARDPAVRSLRGDEDYAPMDAARYAGLLLAHELGHALYHFGHPFTEKSCVMYPPPLLRFRQWANDLSGFACHASAAKAMARAAVKMNCALN